MAFEKLDLQQVYEALGRNAVREQVVALATNAVIIVVLAFIIAIICVGRT